MGKAQESLDINHLEISRMQLRQLQHRFLLINEKRKKIFEQNSEQNEKDFIELLPLLFHINHPTLPGYTTSETPCGLYNYQVDKNTLQRAKKYARSLDYKPTAMMRYAIDAIYLMGSAGSIAHSGRSDLDIWVCMSDQLTEKEHEALTEKRNKIQQWSESLGLDCAIYLVNRSQMVDASAENDKETTEASLLLDEFYRTQVYLAGKFMLWWLVPPEWESQYELYANKLIQEKYIDECEWVDFGRVAQFELKDFVKNALWYINKALSSPYKAALKLVLMESYLYDYPEVKPLSMDYKTNIYNLVENSTVVDPYLLMHRKVEDYLVLNDQMERLEFIRRCLYQKMQVRLSNKARSNTISYQIMNELVEEWEWTDEKIELFDRRYRWTINEIGHEKKLYVKQLISSFRTIGETIKKHDKIFEENEKELVRLSRKLSANLELTQGKIELVNINFVPRMADFHLSLVRQNKSKDMELWSMYDHPVNQTNLQSLEPIYQCNSLIELLVWAHINGLISSRTAMQYRDSMQQLHYDEIERIVRFLLNYSFSEEECDNQVFDKEPVIEKMSCFINVAHDRLSTLAKQGVHIITERSDPLSFGNQRYNLVETIDLLYQNSWGELFVIHFKGEDALSRFACAVLELIERQSIAPKIEYFSFSSMRSEELNRRVKSFIEQVIVGFSRKDKASSKFIYQLGKTFRVLLYRKGRYGFFKTDDVLSLSQHTVSRVGQKQWISLEKQCFSDSVVEQALSLKKPNHCILMVNIASISSPSFCFVDQIGGILYGKLPQELVLQTVSHLLLFLREAIISSSDETSDVNLDCWVYKKPQEKQAWNYEKAESNTKNRPLSLELDTSNKKTTLFIESGKHSFTFDWEDIQLHKKYQQWLDRAFGITPQQVYIHKLTINKEKPPSTLSKRLLDRHRIEQRLLGN